MASELNNHSMPPWVIFHVPHDSKVIPGGLRGSFNLTDAALSNELSIMTDHYTRDLYTRDVPQDQVVAAGVSRLVVDVERYLDDAKEPMAKVGMGVIYTQTHDGRSLRHDPTSKERHHLIKHWYEPHHRRLEDLVSLSLQKYGLALIIDCHSYSSICLPHESHLPTLRPEVCLGTDAYHTDTELVETLIDELRLGGLEVGINTPFSGSLVTLPHYSIDRRVQSVMIEVRRDLYMNESTEAISANYEMIRARLRSCISCVGDMAGKLISKGRLDQPL